VKGMTVEELFADVPIEITIIQTRPCQCKIGIDAPQELVIRRDEIYQEN
jgi:carbon storage regulator CsrA